MLQDNSQDWFEIQDCGNGVTRIREPALGPLDSCNMWLVSGSRASLLIDTGVGVAPLAPLIARLSPLPLICLLTHSHFDHIGGAHEFTDRRIHAAEADILAYPTPEATLWRGWLTASCFSRPPRPDFAFSGFSIAPAPATQFVHEGARVDLGGRDIEILHLPGHSPGLVAAFDRAGQTLFTSDALYDGQMFFDLPGSNRRDAISSLERLDALQPRITHPGHFESFASARFQQLIAETLAAMAL